MRPYIQLPIYNNSITPMYDAVALVWVNAQSDATDANHINFLATWSAFRLKQKHIRFYI